MMWQRRFDPAAVFFDTSAQVQQVEFVYGHDLQFHAEAHNHDLLFFSETRRRGS